MTNRNLILAMASQAILALDDGKITSEELIYMFNLLIKMSGVDLKGEFYEMFIEQDGDAHIIIKRTLLDKLKIGV